MVWVVIALIFVVAFGPILWLRPSPRQRRLASLRQRAYGHGLRVELRRLPIVDLDPEQRVNAGGRALDSTRECAAYVMPLGRRLRRLPTWRVMRGGEGMAAAKGWTFEPGKRPDHSRLALVLDAVAPALADFPADVVALECEPIGIAAYWLEGPDATPQRVDELAAQLAALAEALRALEARLDREAEPGNI